MLLCFDLFFTYYVSWQKIKSSSFENNIKRRIILGYTDKNQKSILLWYSQSGTSDKMKEGVSVAQPLNSEKSEHWSKNLLHFYFCLIRFEIDIT
jgi:hypothetical protein